MSKPKRIISEERWEEMWDCLVNSPFFNSKNKSVAEAMHKMYPEYSLKDIKKAEDTYDANNNANT